MQHLRDTPEHRVGLDAIVRLLPGEHLAKGSAVSTAVKRRHPKGGCERMVEGLDSIVNGAVQSVSKPIAYANLGVSGGTAEGFKRESGYPPKSDGVRAKRLKPSGVEPAWQAVTPVHCRDREGQRETDS